MDELLKSWTAATTNLKYGVQRVFHDVLALAAEGKTHLAYGADYHNGSPCLVNTVGAMLTTGGGSGIPGRHFGEVVELFDSINREFAERGINTEYRQVSEVAAETLLRNFAPLKEPETPMKENEFGFDGPYMEPSDEYMAKALVEIFSNPGIMEQPATGCLIFDAADAINELDLAVHRTNVDKY